MKTQKSFWDILPPHYWTGILGGVIYLVWAGITFYLHEHWNYYGRNSLVLIPFTMVHLPTYLYLIISDLIIDRALENANGGSVYALLYHFTGYIIPFVFFVLAGFIIGKTSKDPRREAIRRRVIVVLFIIALIVWTCLASMFVFVMND